MDELEDKFSELQEVLSEQNEALRKIEKLEEAAPGVEEYDDIFACYAQDLDPHGKTTQELQTLVTLPHVLAVSSSHADASWRAAGTQMDQTTAIPRRSFWGAARRAQQCGIRC